VADVNRLRGSLKRGESIVSIARSLGRSPEEVAIKIGTLRPTTLERPGADGD
jgi:hypothetical protein